MKTLTIWSAAMSLFFSLSVSESVYVAGKGYLTAGAGNPAIVERTLGELVGRMGGPAEMPAAPQAPRSESVAMLSPSKDALKPVAEWVERSGTPTYLPAEAARLLSVGFADGQNLPTVQKRYRMEAAQVIHVFDTAVVDGRRVYLLRRLSPSLNVAWRVTADGEILNTITVSQGRMTVEANDAYRSLFEESAEFFLSMLPKSSVG